MAYEPTSWASGDVVTSAKLNKLEKGVSDATKHFVVTFTLTGNTGVGDKTWNELEAAYDDGIDIRFRTTSGDHGCSLFRHQSEGAGGMAQYIGFSTGGGVPYYGIVTGSGDNPVTVNVNY